MSSITYLCFWYCVKCKRYFHYDKIETSCAAIVYATKGTQGTTMVAGETNGCELFFWVEVAVVPEGLYCCFDILCPTKWLLVMVSTFIFFDCWVLLVLEFDHIDFIILCLSKYKSSFGIILNTKINKACIVLFEN